MSRKIATKLMQLLPNYDQIKNDNNWKKRLFFIEAMLLIANAPFHLKSKENEEFSIALLVRGVELLNNFIDKYPLNENRRFNIININIEYDLNMAKELFSKEEAYIYPLGHMKEDGVIYENRIPVNTQKEKGE